ncbi:MAG: HD domain-containing protein, partial [bacterium]|nr:HD domain-containing protein [bacterium]
NREPKDWDITTNATPEQIIPLFEKTVYENTFGTVGVCVPLSRSDLDSTFLTVQVRPGQLEVNHETPEYDIIEVTPYRIEAKYSDFRHPDEVKFSIKLEDDLKRRDFTVNAIAMSDKGHITDMFDGIKDIENKILRTVGEADERFGEDPLRMLRAVRFAVQLDFTISHETTKSIVKNSELIKKISTERIRDEFVKIIMSKNPMLGIAMLQKFNLLKNIIPELEDGINCIQGGAHKYDVYEHLLQALQHAADKNWPLEIRLSALFHDIGKPKTRRVAGATAKASPKEFTFYGHEVVGARMTKKLMERMKFPRKEIDFVESMIRNHMFFSDTEQITLSAVRRIIVKVGKENIWLLMNVRECDRVGMAKKEAPYRLRKYHAMIEECLRDPISVGQLKIDGNYLMELNIKAGPRMGSILNALLEEVLENPEKNTVEYLKERAVELEKLNDKDLRALGEKAKEKKEELEDAEISKLHQKHGVKK